jgi:hypothetical protein
MCVVAPDPLGGLQCTAHPAVPDPTSLQGGLLAATHPVVPYGLQVSNIKEILADLPVQLGSHVPKKCAHVSKAPDVRAIMGLQDMRADITFNAYKICRQVAIVQRRP